MDNSLSESARFAVYREKLKGICEANNLSYVFIKNAYPIKLVIRPLGGVGEQMSMLEEATEDNYISPGASILFTVKDGNLTYRMSKTFTMRHVPQNCHTGRHLRWEHHHRYGRVRRQLRSPPHRAARRWHVPGHGHTGPHCRLGNRCFDGGQWWSLCTGETGWNLPGDGHAGLR